ncbi:MAG TPA: hypothetical protein VJP85_08540 [Candidatus Baltobacteraceae bacterium]|nr:hypothetical protein [Candidatus Baltobacteraceae bacterium]
MESANPGAPCPLCLWSAQNDEYSLHEARANVAEYGVIYRPADRRFAVVRHPILGPNGEYAIDRVALRARAYLEFRAFGSGKPDYAEIPPRLCLLLQTISTADRLYTR